MKDNNAVIQEFNQYVNMSSAELESWLKSDDSKSAGWPKGTGSDESVGRDSGHKIVEILKANPRKDPAKYTDEQIQHMRKVAAYCKRHLAQEGKTLRDKPVDEAKKSKSYISLKNWGHDPLEGKDGKKTGDSSGPKKSAGSKRKAGDNQEGKSKKQETEKEDNSSSRESRAKARDERKQKQEQGEGSTKKSGDQKQDKGQSSNATGTNAEKGPKPGQTVSWNWGAGAPKGKVLDVKGEKTTITTKRGNKVSRDGDPKDPAVVIDTGKSKAVKSNHELN